MTYTGQNIQIFQGDTRTLTVTVYDRNDDVTSIAGATGIKWVVYKRTTGTIYLEKSLGSGITITDGPNGLFEIALANADTINLLGKYNHECEFVDASNNVSTLFTGYFTVTASKANN
jgi:hypothetical protein